ncbi:MAG TPA: glycerophosphodiester phosphodiesterase family protein [Flavobacteriales bacterium]|nr:glycerophosphodiester phosphodiesterase family protein [Flavobacteriales bacterium]
MTRLAPLLFVPLWACAEPDPSGVHIIGHGGLGRDAEFPMDSREALLGGLALGIDGVEFDVQLTADSVLVAYHDQDLSARTTCSGLVNGKTWAELTGCSNTIDRNIPYPLVRLDSLLIKAVGEYPSADFTFDCKVFAEGDWWSYLHLFARALGRLNSEPALHGHFVVECQVDDFLQLLRSEQPDIPLFLYATDMPGDMERAHRLGCAGITVDDALVTEAQVRHAHGIGLQVALFGVGSTWGHREALAKHPDRLQTDAPQDLVPQKD